MAVPTITSISPATGPAAGGNLVIIAGTNFAVPTMAYAVPAAALAPRVSVTVGGRAARRVEVVSATQLRVLMPRYWHQDTTQVTFGAVNVIVSNLSTAFVVVPGEVATAVAGYTYARWDLGAPHEDPPLYKIARELMWALSLEVERNCYWAVHVDYGDVAAVEINVAQLPSINLTLATPRDLEYSQWDNYPEEVDISATEAKLFEGARTHMLVVDLYLTGEGTREAMALAAAVEEFVQVNPELRVLADQTLYPGVEDSYPVEISRDPSPVSMPNTSGVVTY
ncbi:MAG: IPT/TIG domain-containing protein, partial [Thermoleophilia bacterium]|nr:IPT/TIG domain-containing protein [Thermoleophilia bacterium]